MSDSRNEKKEVIASQIKWNKISGLQNSFDCANVLDAHGHTFLRILWFGSHSETLLLLIYVFLFLLVCLLRVLLSILTQRTERCCEFVFMKRHFDRVQQPVCSQSHSLDSQANGHDLNDINLLSVAKVKDTFVFDSTFNLCQYWAYAHACSRYLPQNPSVGMNALWEIAHKKPFRSFLPFFSFLGFVFCTYTWRLTLILCSRMLLATRCRFKCGFRQTLLHCRAFSSVAVSNDRTCFQAFCWLFH